MSSLKPYGMPHPHRQYALVACLPGFEPARRQTFQSPTNVNLFEISRPGERDLHVTGGQMVGVNFCRIEMASTV